MSKTGSKTAEDIYRDVQQLSPEERELLTTMLHQDDAPAFASPEIEQAWLDEVERIERLASEGKMETFAWEDVRERLYRRLGAQRN
jgi:hypothetical protein